MIFGEYLVTGKRRYRGHEPGTIFEARLDPNAEQRAIGRGDIRLLRSIKPGIEMGHAVFPEGWFNGVPPQDNIDSTEGG